MKGIKLIRLAAMTLLGLLCSNAWALQYEVTYDKTFTETEFMMWYEATSDIDIFGVDELSEARFHMSLHLNPGAAPIFYYANGSMMNISGYDRTLRNDLYGYAATAISNLTVSFGTKTWDIADLDIPHFGIGDAALWMDSPLVDDGTSEIVIQVADEDGHAEIGWMWMGSITYGMYQDGRVDVTDYSPFSTIFGQEGVTSIRALAPVPGPAPLLLLGTGLAGMAMIKGRVKRLPRN